MAAHFFSTMNITMSGLLRILPSVFVEFVPLCESANYARAIANMLRALVDALLNCIAAELSGVGTSVLGSSAAKAVNMIAKHAPLLLFREVDCRRHGFEGLTTSVMHVLCAANSAGKRICNTTPVVCLAAVRKAFDEARIQEKCTRLASPDQLFRFSTWGLLAMWPQWGVPLGKDFEDGAGTEQKAESKAAEMVPHAAWRRVVFRDLVLHAPRALVDSGVSEQVFIENCARETKAKIADATRHVRGVVLQMAGH